MNSIYHLHRTLGFLKSELKTVCFGFPYTGAMKVLENIGSGCIFFGHGSEEEIDTLEKQLADPTNERVLSIFCEIPSNPLLKTPNIRRLRALADQHDVPLLIDGTVGGFSNCQVFPYADVMVVSLTKSFSGASDVMGGWQGTRLQHALNVDDGSGHPGYKDTTWWEDVVVLERNSRTFKERDAQSNRTAEIISDYLHNHPKVARVYYPKYMCKDDYNSYKRPGGGYGNLLSFELYTEEAAQTFFNALSCAKGPSFGTNFSLAIPYTPIVHFDEMEWAKSYGLEAYLIRFGVGLESADQLREWFDDAFAVVPATPSAV
ncbi:pyridoxal phosphate-dependent transferase [Syncephalis plumigaleata]|nr:pyridoxal phosphate-dependent transferase [Syncephalis plumigaleata]